MKNKIDKHIIMRLDNKILVLIIFFFLLFIPISESVVNLKPKNNITYNYFNITSTNIETNVSLNYGYNGSWKGMAVNNRGHQLIALSGIQSNITYNVEAGNTTAQMILAVNSTKLLINWSNKFADKWNTTLQMITACNSTGLLKNWSYIDTDTNTWNTTAQMILAVNTTKLLINWSNKITIPTGGHIGYRPNLYNDSTYMYFNETRNNVTIRAIANFNINYINFLGSGMTGTDGQVNRTYSVDADMVTVDNFHLHPYIDYNVTAGTLKLYNPVWDTQQLTAWVNMTFVPENFLGSDCNKLDGQNGRILIVNNPELVIVDNFMLQPNIDYRYNSTMINFTNPIWDTQIITIYKR